MELLYTAIATSVGGRGGKVATSDGALEVEVRHPKEMGGPEGVYTNPEQLFAAGFSACFNSAMMAVAAQKKPILGSSVTAKVSISKSETTGFYLSLELDVNIPNVSQGEAEQIVADAHQMCPYSKATRNNIEVTFNVTTK